MECGVEVLEFRSWDQVSGFRGLVLVRQREFQPKKARNLRSGDLDRRCVPRMGNLTLHEGYDDDTVTTTYV